MQLNQRRLLPVLSLAALFAAGAAFSQERGNEACPCSNPVKIHQEKKSGTTNGHKPDFPAIMRMNQMTYDDKGKDKHFTDTISWKLPTSTCETQVKVQWTVKNNNGDGLQANDTTGLWLNGAPVVSHKIGPLPKNGTKSFSQTLTSAQAKEGRISLVAQDDTAVIDFKVDVVGCCITPN